ncbi:Isochorismatase [Fulvivirga imtechensis AK7]|uniref:Isochorismatase n=1 Tax=Fulvivirga imtechensis AK7 TaxID=1237149 RepID=L8JV27_9BACT|nr:cysteine hydrolase family protein [Fulvivirga imtechensis]ELR72861.1 Isochorismatase [Fulvivirga imtechensis AK7]
MQHKKALLIIDMQKGSFTPVTPRYDTAGVVKRINLLAQLFRKNDLPVIFVQHDGTKGGAFIPNTTEWELLAELDVKANDIIVSKEANDAFYRTNLEKLLHELEVNHLVVTGCATDFCVESTIQSALTKNFDITVVSNGHTTGERPSLSAEKVIQHYNWIWKNMIPTEGKIVVVDFDEIEV